MKNIYLLYILVIAAFTTGCSKTVLDEQSKDRITADAVFNTPEGLNTAVIALYDRERNLFRMDAETQTATAILRGGDIQVSRAGGGANAGRYDVTFNPASSEVQNFWRHRYSIIERANAIIAGGERIGDDNPIVAKAVAEAKVFRAQAFFYLFRTYDNIILNTDPTTVDNLNREYHPAKAEDIYDLLYADLDYAIEKLSYPTATRTGRFDQGVARHIKAQVALWRKDYAEAAQQADAVINSGAYSLRANINEVFQGIGSNHADLNHSESILVSQWSREPGGSAGLNGHRMANYFIPNFYKESRILVNYANGGRGWGRIHPNPYMFSLFTKDNNGKTDLRRATWFKETWVYDNPANAGSNLGKVVPRPNDAATYFDRFYPACLKYVDRVVAEGGTKLAETDVVSFKDIIIYRLAETYLIGAEAHMRLKGGDDATAKLYLSKIRERAGLGTFTGTVTEDIIIDEDARELAFEKPRWYILKRLGKLVSAVRDHGGDPTVATGTNDPRTNIQDFHVRWPIPQGEIDGMTGKGTFVQNPGYQ